MATSPLKVVETDPFGTERFAQLKREIDAFKLGKDELRRLEKIESVFTYRRDIAHQLHHAVDQYPSWNATNLSQRLSTFKPVQYFLDAMQTLLDDIRREALIVQAAKAAKPARRYGW